MRAASLRWYPALCACLIGMLPVTITAQHLAPPTRSAARSGLSAISTTKSAPTAQLALQVSGWQEAERAKETDGGQWVKGGLIGAAIMGGGGYALLNGANGLSDNSWSQWEIVRGSAILAGLGFVIGSLIGSGFEK
jgi:hypothetical protein